MGSNLPEVAGYDQIHFDTKWNGVPQKLESGLVLKARKGKIALIIIHILLFMVVLAGMVFCFYICVYKRLCGGWLKRDKEIKKVEDELQNVISEFYTFDACSSNQQKDGIGFNSDLNQNENNKFNSIDSNEKMDRESLKRALKQKAMMITAIDQLYEQKVEEK